MKKNPEQRDHTLYHSKIDGRESVAQEIAARSPCLTVINGAQIGQVYRLKDGATVIGRGGDVDMVFPFPSVSRRHLMIVNRQNKYMISDLESTNGTYVNRDRIIHPVTLFEGDKITAGEISFRFSFNDEEDTHFQNQLREMAVTDGLTRTFNKRYFMEVAEREFNYARRNAGLISLILFDVDYFKKLNDTYGHEAGDYVLSEMAAVIEGQGRTYDVFARYGGEEFVMLLRGLDMAQSVKLADRIRTLVQNKIFKFGGKEIQITVSLGVAIYQGDSAYDSIGQFIQAADERLYKAKHAGRNQVCSE
ncbi:MAG: GGDEF domain-containing protein [Gammaproteobacteria bacterium]|nr:GGDEF domain-containing protein [Gammaproteobacteria bacterium]